jgi:hypothetical protein
MERERGDEEKRRRGEEGRRGGEEEKRRRGEKERRENSSGAGLTSFDQGHGQLFVLSDLILLYVFLLLILFPLSTHGSLSLSDHLHCSFKPRKRILRLLSNVEQKLG